MSDPRMQKLAATLVDYCAAVQPGDWVRLQADVNALPLVHEVHRRIIQAGGNPSVLLTSDELEGNLLREASDKQLAWISPIEESRSILAETSCNSGCHVTVAWRYLTSRRRYFPSSGEIFARYRTCSASMVL